ncbi:MAG TPA: CotH kinase family protein, partial [Verrucomicrobiota bacterium]|nr:CotH kinase family protein [Verrucomicrobiota bacterium]
MICGDELRPKPRLAWLGFVGAVAVGTALFGMAAGAHNVSEIGSHASLSGASLFNITQVWTVELWFTPDQWEAMEPKGGPNPFGPPGAPQAGPGGPRPFDGSPGAPGPEGFGPGMFIAPMFMQAGDANRDQKLTKRELTRLAEKWFGQWDTNRSGTLNLEKVRDGINAFVTRPGMGGPGGPPRPGGGPPIQGRPGQRNGVAGAMGVVFPTVQADLEFEGLEFPGVTVRYKGNGTFMESRNTMKRSLKIDLNDNVRGRKLAGISKLNLHNNVTDASWMNEVLSHKLYRDAGVPAPRTAYARVYVEVPGKLDRTYLGLYSIVENIDRNFLQDRFGTRNGALFKPATREPFTDLGDDWAAYEQSYDPKTPLSKADVARVMSFAKLVSHAPDAEFEKRLAEFLDVDEFARFMAVTVWLSTLDSILMIGQNFYVYLNPETGKFVFMPWDLDHSFGQFPMGGTQEQRENLNIHRPWVGDNRFLERIFQVPEFKERYLGYLREFSRTIFRPERFHQQVDEIAAAIRPFVREESEEKLARFDRVVAGESVPRLMFGGGPGRRDRAPDRSSNNSDANDGGGPSPFFGPPPMRMAGPTPPMATGPDEEGRRPAMRFGMFGQPEP